MQRNSSHIRDALSLLAQMFRFASCLSRGTGILACVGTSRLGSMHDISGWKPRLRLAAFCCTFVCG